MSISVSRDNALGCVRPDVLTVLWTIHYIYFTIDDKNDDKNDHGHLVIVMVKVNFMKFMANVS